MPLSIDGYWALIWELFLMEPSCISSMRLGSPVRKNLRQGHLQGPQRGNQRLKYNFLASPVLIDSNTESAVELEGWDSIEEESDTSSIKSCITLATLHRGPIHYTLHASTPVSPLQACRRTSPTLPIISSSSVSISTHVLHSRTAPK